MEQSLFGPSVADVQSAIESQFIKNNSSLDLGNMSARAGYALGSGIGSLLGMEDPRVAEAKRSSQVLKEMNQEGISLDDPEEYYKRLAGKFQSLGLTAQAEKAAMKALEYRDKKEERQFKLDDRKAQQELRSAQLAIEKVKLTKELEKAREKPGFTNLLELVKAMSAANLDQESIVAAVVDFNTTGSFDKAVKLLRNKKEKPDKPNEIGTTPDYRQVYTMTDSDGKQRQYVLTADGKEQPYYGPVDRKTATGSSTTNIFKGPSEEVALRTKFTESTKDARDMVIAGSQALSHLKEATTNSAAAKAAQNAFAKTYRVDSNTSKAEVERLLGIGSLPDRVVQDLKGYFQGTLSEETVKTMSQVLRRSVSEGRKRIEAEKSNFNKLQLPKSSLDFITSTNEIPTEGPSAPSKETATVPTLSPETQKRLQALDKLKGK